MSPCHFRDCGANDAAFVPHTFQPIADGQTLGNYVRKLQYDRIGNLEPIDHHSRSRIRRCKGDQLYAAYSNRPTTSIAGCAKEDPG